MGDLIIIWIFAIAIGGLGGWVMSDYRKTKRITRWKVALGLAISALAMFVAFTPGPITMFLDYWFR